MCVVPPTCWRPTSPPDCCKTCNIIHVLNYRRLSLTGTQPVDGSASELVDISPSELVGLTLPVYKAMSPKAGATGLSKEEMITVFTAPNHYTSVSFVRLLILAGRRLRLSPTHFKAVLDVIMNDSGMILASNFSQEQVGKSYVGA